jgi:FkbM family methyltransferase
MVSRNAKRDVKERPSAIGRLVFRGLASAYRAPQSMVTRLRRRALGFLRDRLIAAGDPLVRMPLGDAEIVLHLSHMLPLYKAAFPFYDTLLPRLCEFVSTTDGRLEMIDVGANIGDTVLHVPRRLHARFLCIEADERYLPLLELNTRGVAGVTIRHAICDETAGETTAAPVHTGGTSRLADVASGVVNTRVTLDQIAAGVPEFRANILKVDTDGFDYRVLRGAERLVARDQPIIALEVSPSHLEEAGDDPRRILPWLAGHGYGAVSIYDNLGRHVARLSTGDVPAFDELVARARSRTEYYYDLVAFPVARAADAERFFSAEDRFFATAAAS